MTFKVFKTLVIYKLKEHFKENIRKTYKSMTPEERFEFGVKSGYIDNDYNITK